MPMYRVKCLKCHKVFEEFARIGNIDKIKCECGGDTSWVPSACNYQSTMFGKENAPLVLEHMTEMGEPLVKVTTKSQLKEACKEHDCISPILD